MRRGLLAWAAAWAFVLIAPLHAAEFPYTAEVNSDDVYVRSGPGKNYYPTDKLRKGESVEIYRHDPGGWCAIKPPRDSFSWVSAKHLDPVGHGLGAATTDRVVVRVGSAFSDVRDVIQVRLEKGERVELLATGDAAGASWYKIMPPSGEFRWISSKYLDRRDGEGPVGEGETAAAEDSGAVQLTSGTEPESSPPPATKREPISVPTPVFAGSASAKPGSTPKMTEAQINKELLEIDAELSAMVSEEITAWSFGELRRRAERCLDDAPTALSRGRVRVVLNKMGRFEDLKLRHDTVASTREETDRHNRQLGDAPDLNRSEAGAPRYDGIGRLSPVMARRGNYPQYALVDNRGEVVMFVNPAPGVNLRQYVNKQVGVNGPRTFMSQLQKQQIDAQRIAVLPGRSQR